MGDRTNEDVGVRIAPWSEGHVDRTKAHIKIRYGGILDDDPPGVDIAFVGPSADEALIVEFLPMPEVDEKRAEELKRRAAWHTQMVTKGWNPPWPKLLYQTSTASNAYGPLRYLQEPPAGDAESP